jgi:hypothetical protein
MDHPGNRAHLRTAMNILILMSLFLSTAFILPANQAGMALATNGSFNNSNNQAKPAIPQGGSNIAYLPVVRKGISNLKSLVSITSLTLPAALEAAGGNWCTWSYCYLSPRLYQEPLGNDQTLVGWTDASGNGHVSIISNNSISRSDNFSGLSVHGLTVHSDGGYAVLLWNPTTTSMWLSKRKANGDEIWKIKLNSTIAQADFDIGDSRLAYGNGLYAAYFTVYGVSGIYKGHNGDQLSYINDSGGIQSGGWDWGCSHSMAELIEFHPDLQKFIPICSSDCYASKGILIEDNKVIYQCDGNCGGMVSAQLGQVAPSINGWKLIFNALNRPSGIVGKGIGLASIDGAFQSRIIWLTDTEGDYESDPVLAHIGTSLNIDRFLAGWTTTNDGKYWLGVIDGSGKFIMGPEEVSSVGIKWGNRDDSLRTRLDGSINWLQGEAGSNILNLFRFDGRTFIP